MQLITLISTLIISAYIICVAAFLWIRGLWSRAGEKTVPFLNRANLMLLPGLAIYWIGLISSCISRYQIHATDETGLVTVHHASSNQWILVTLAWGLIFGGFFHLLFLKRSNRVRPVLSLISVLLLLLLINYEWLLAMYSSFLYRDARPAAWVFYQAGLEWLSVFGLGALYFVICWMAPHRRTVTVSR